MTIAAAELSVGQRFEEIVVDDLTRTQIVMYAGASGDFHPLHTDERYARAMGLPGVFAHGMLTMGLMGKLLTHRFGHDRLTRYRARFAAQVWPGDTLTATATVREIRNEGSGALVELDLETRNQAGELVLSGDAWVRVEA